MIADLAASGWMDAGACHGDGDLFTGDPKPKPAELAKAAAICANCPVLTECGDYADDEDVRWGLWAGRWRGPVKRADVARYVA